MATDRKPLSQRAPKLDNQLSRLLDEFLKNEGEVVSREYLIDRIWLGNEYVGRSALTKNIWRLRNAIKSSDTLSHYCIETIPKQGYRLVSKRKISLKRVFNGSSRISNMAIAFLSLLFIFMFLYAATTENVDYVAVPSDNQEKLPHSLSE